MTDFSMSNFDLGCAVLSLATYISGRKVENIVPPLSGAEKLALPGVADGHVVDAGTGFEASVYRFQGRVVIAYAGTNTDEGADLWADVSAGMGHTTDQLKQAAKFYYDVKAQYGDDVVFTGHSLGGGLAALMGVFFNKPAVTFDPAPFRLAATMANAVDIRDYLDRVGYGPQAYSDVNLGGYNTTETRLALALPGLIPALIGAGYLGGVTAVAAIALGLQSFPTVIPREGSIKAYSVSGEFLTNGYKGIGADLENTLRIKSTSQPTPIDINPSSVSGLDLHSQALLVVAATAPSIIDIIKKSPAVAEDLFDKNLYSNKGSSATADFLNKLVQEEYGGASPTGYIAKFVSDLQKIIPTTGTSTGTASVTAVQNALVIAAMDYYYSSDAARASAAFESEGGSISFNYDDFGQVVKSNPRLISAINSLLSETDQRSLGVAQTLAAKKDETLATGLLKRQNAWHIQTGSGAMTWTATGNNKDAAVGGTAGDTLDGGAGDDILMGLGGADSLLGGSDDDVLLGGDDSDTLDGGTGEDTLSGGAGTDSYHFAAGWGHDTIDDSDGQGSIQVDGIGSIDGSGAKKVAEGVWQTDDKKINYTLVSRDPAHNDLYVTFSDRTDVIQIRNWSNSNLGISLSDVAAQPAPSNPMVGDYMKKTNEAGTRYLIGNDGNYVPDGDDPGAADLITGTSGADSIQGLGGNDALLGRLGDDFIDGGDGSDVIEGGLGADTLNGGTGNDVIYGSSSGALEYPTDIHFQPPVNTDPVVIARGFNWVIDSPGLDSDGYQQGFLTFTVSRDEQAGDSRNIIDGGAGNDVVFAGTGSDVVHGGDDNDDIYGMAGGDMLFGDAGNDRIRGDGPDTSDALRVNATLAADHGADVISGGAGNDLLMGQGNDDELYGGADNDTLYGDDRDTRDTPANVNGNDYLDGGDGADKLYGGGRDDELFGGAGNDSLWGDAGAQSQTSTGYIAPQYQGDDYLDGEDGNDYLQGEGGDDTLFGGKDNDTLFGDDAVSRLPGANQGDDYLDGEDGNDALVGGGGDDTLFGGIGDDNLDGDDVDSSVPTSFQGNDYLDGEAGSDTLMGRGGDDTLFGGSESDLLDGGDGNDVLVGGTGGDALKGGAGDDTYVIGAGEASDSVQGDTITDTQGQDVIEWDGVDLGTLQAIQVGKNLALTPDGNQAIFIMDGLTSSITAIRSGGAEVSLQALVGTQLTTVVTATTDRTDSNLLGGANDDQLTAAHAGAQVWGGHGSDTIKVNTGQGATVNMTVGDGTDQVIAVHRDAPADPNAAVPQNILRLGQGFDGSQLKLFKVGAQSYVLSLNDQGDGIRFDATTSQDGTIAAGDQPFDAVKTAYGGTITWQAIVDRGIWVLPSATNQNDTFTLSPIGDVISGLDGNDYIDGLAGNDVLYGGNGDDTLLGGYGNDTLYANSGGDSLVGGDGNDVLYSGDTNAYDALEGGEGDDQYYFRQGYYINVDATATDSSLTSNDSYRVRDSGQVGGPVLQTLTIADAGGASDTLQFESTLVTPTNTKVISTGTGFKLTSWNLTVDIQNAMDAAGNKGAGSIESVVFKNGVVWTADQLKTISQQTTSGSDTVFGSGSNDTIDGGAGDDRINGFTGNDSLLGGAGYDYLNGGAGVDTLEAGADGGSLVGDEGDDTYVVRAGQGNVFLGTGGRGQSGDLGYDVLSVQANATDVTTSYVRGGSDYWASDRIVVSWKDGTTTASFNLYGTQLGASDAVEEIRYADGSHTNVAQFVSALLPMATSGADSLQMSSLDDSIAAGDGNDQVYGYGGNDTLLGGNGDDMLYAGYGDDYVDGGSGDDSLYMGGGNDTVAFGAGSGIDLLVTESGLSVREQTTVLLDAAVNPADVHLKWTQGSYQSRYDETGTQRYSQIASGTLTLTLGAGADQLSVAVSNISATDSALRDVRFQGGPTWSLDSLIAMANVATEGDDLLIDSSSTNYLQGGNGNDTLYGMKGHTLDGGAGDDYLVGSDDNDELIGGLGVDTLVCNGGTNTIVYALGDGNDLVSSQSGGQTILRLGAGIGPNDIAVSRQSLDLTIQFSDGGSVTFRPVKYTTDLPLKIQFANGDSWTQSQILDKLLAGTSGNDSVSGFLRDDSMVGGNGNDSLTGFVGNDTLNGGEGDDTLTADGYGSWSNGLGKWDQDVLIGGAGDDLLYGGLGYNTYQFDAGFGHDTIVASYDHNASAPTVISFGAGIQKGNVQVSHGLNSGDYVLSIPATGDAVQFHMAADDQIRFADDTIWYQADLDARVVYAITEVSEVIYGSGQADVIDALGGNDIVYAGDGNDLVRGGRGEDYLYGDAGDDTLIGGAGYDVLSDSGGNDRYEYQLGDGSDSIVDSAGTNDVLVLGPGILPGKVEVVPNLSEAINGRYAIALTDSGERIYFSGIESVVFANGTIWSATYIDSLARVAYGSSDNDVMNGSALADTLYGLEGDDQLNGLAGNDWLDGGSGADVMKGGTGDDTYVVDDIGDVVTESSGQGTDKVYSSITYTLKSNVENLELTGTDAIDGTGNSLVNSIVGNSGNNVLDGGTGADQMSGGKGDDTYKVDNSADTVQEFDGEGTDLVMSSITYSIANYAYVENLTLTLTAAINATGNDGDNRLTGNSAINTLTGGKGNDTLDGGAGADILVGGEGDDTYVIDNAGDKITENAGQGTDSVQSSLTFTLANTNLENLTLTGSSAINGTGNGGKNWLIGNSGANTLTGGDDNDILDGGAGNDVLIGGTGDDYYVLDTISDTVTEKLGEGTDTVQTSFTYTLGDNVENLVLIGTEALRTVTGNWLSNRITGSSANDTLDGGAGVDVLIGGDGDDLYLVDETNDVIVEGANAGMDRVVSSAATYTLSENIDSLGLAYGVSGALSGIGNDMGNQLDGNEFDNTLTGMDGNDTLSGDSGDDTLIGGLGNDTYWVDSPDDVIVEWAGEGYEQVVIYGTASYTLGANLEKGTAQINFAGTTLVGNAEGNFLIGSNYADTLRGGEGYDVINAGKGNDSLDGGVGNDTLDGGLGNDTLDGGVGDDSMTGGAGNDTFIVDAIGDSVNEVENGGTDTVQSSISYTLRANVENLTLTGTDSYRIATGNALNNVITGSSGGDTLDGGEGADILIGGDGDDTYMVDNLNDVVTETASGGGDRVVSSLATYTLGGNVEGLALAFGVSSALNGVGNDLANELVGNEFNNKLTGWAGNDVLNGDAGDDTMEGGVGDDTYWVDSSADVVTELSGEGYDQVYVLGATDYVLSANVEKATAQLSAEAVTLTGNVDANSLIGSNYADNLIGGAGDDTLSGGKGNDWLYGGEGADSYYGQAGSDILIDQSLSSNDTYVWGRGQGADTVTDSGGTDLISVLSGVTADQIWLRHVSNNLEISVIGTSDKLTITDWYASSANQVESFKLADNKTLTASHVQALVDAMASFAPPAAGQTTLPADYQSTLNPVIASNWA